MAKTLVPPTCIWCLSVIVGFVWRQLESAFFGAVTSVAALFDFCGGIILDNIIVNGKFNESKGKASYITGCVMLIIGFLLLIGGVASSILLEKIYFIFGYVIVSAFLIIGGISSVVAGSKILKQKLDLTETYLTCTSYHGLTEKLQYSKVISVTKYDGLQTIQIQYGSATPIHFSAMLNYKEVYEFITDKINNTPAEENPTSMDETEQLKKYKKLLDDGIITQEEFDTKKKQLLGL